MPAGSSFYCVVVAERERGRGFLCWHNMRGACSTHSQYVLLPSTIPYHSLVVVLLLCLSFVFGFPPKTSECCNQLLTYEVLVLVVSEQHLKMMMWKWNTNVYNELNFVSFPINCQFNLFFSLLLFSCRKIGIQVKLCTSNPLGLVFLFLTLYG